MLHSKVAMLNLIALLGLFLYQDAQPAITFPRAGEELRGQVEIIGSMNLAGFSSAELEFSYFASTPADAWFVLQTFPQPVRGPALAVWDTTTLTDGDYALRLRVFLLDGRFQEVIVPGLKIRNDAPPPTAAQPPTQETLSSIQLSTPLSATLPLTETQALPQPSATPFPLNPITVMTASIPGMFALGALVVFFLFLFFSLTLRLRKSN